ILRDAGRRAEYERFWLRAVGPIARLADGDDGVPVAPAASGLGTRTTPERRVVMVAVRGSAPPVPTEAPTSESLRTLQEASARLADAQAGLDQRLGES